MRKISWWGCFPLLAVFLAISSAKASDLGPYGDGHPIPWACVDFSGNWKSDDGKQLVIEQRKCSWLKMRTNYGLQEGTTVIVPDDKIRSFTESSFRGVVRYRWNSSDYGLVLETSRVICYENRTVNEYVTLERVGNDNLLLETTYRTTYFDNVAKPRREVRQQQLRRVSR